ncbi:VAMP5 protein, partial [Alcedo cyanopectus]|nr:VAMP5 protein [Ceyx cyanopectus]
PRGPMSPRSSCRHGLLVPMSSCPSHPHSPHIPSAPQCRVSLVRVPRVPLVSLQAGLARCQREAEEVTELMKQNFARALEREGRLHDLDSRAQELRTMGETFSRCTQAVAQQQRRGHRRWRLVALGLATAGLLLLLVLVLSLALSLAPHPPAQPPTAGTEPPSAAGRA